MRRSLILLTAFILTLAAVLFIAFRKGSRRYEFPVHFFSQGIPLPTSSEFYSGSAKWKGADRVKINFSPKAPPDKKKEPHLFCIGFVNTAHKTVYILQYSGGLLIEKADYVEPFLDAVRMAMIKYSNNGKIPSSVNPNIALVLPWKDRELLDELNRWNQDVRTVDTRDFLPW